MKNSLFSKIGRLAVLSMVFFLAASNIAAAQEKITVKMQDATLESVLDAMEQQSKYLFLCDKVDLSHRLTVNVDNLSIDEALSRIFKDTDITWEITGTNVYVSRKQEDAAKGGKVSGTVLDATGWPVIGAAVLIQGTTVGASTDIDGNFEFDLPDGQGGQA